MEVDRDNAEGNCSVVSAIDEVSADADEGGETSNNFHPGLELENFHIDINVVLEKYNAKFSDFLSDIFEILGKLDNIDHQINLKKKSFRKRMRSAVDTSTELSEKIRKIAERARDEDDEEESEENNVEDDQDGEEGDDYDNDEEANGNEDGQIEEEDEEGKENGCADPDRDD